MQVTQKYIICAMDVETTGLKSGYNDLIQIAIVPLGPDLKPYKKIMPFNMHLKPFYPDRADLEAMEINKLRLADLILKGTDPYDAADLFDTWFKRLPFKGINPRILPLGHNYLFDKPFIEHWLGEGMYSEYFDPRYRDTMVSVNFMNDKAYFRGIDLPFPKSNLSMVANKLGIKYDNKHDALYDAICTAECYRRLVQHIVFGESLTYSNVGAQFLAPESSIQDATPAQKPAEGSDCDGSKTV